MKTDFAAGTQYALMEHLDDPRRVEEYVRMEVFSRLFLGELAGWWTPDYRWPKDPLHSWSRIWEYPFVACLARHFLKGTARMLDLGSGTTFFPFYLAKTLNAHVYALDSDPNHERHFRRCARTMESRLGGAPIPVPVQADGRRTGLDDRSFDFVYSVSVLEHVDDPAAVIEEMHRLLKPGGYLAATIDVARSAGSSSGGLHGPSLARLAGAVRERFGADLPGRPSGGQLLMPCNSPARGFGEYRLPRRDLLLHPGLAARVAGYRLMGRRHGRPMKGCSGGGTEGDLAVLAILARKGFVL